MHRDMSRQDRVADFLQLASSLAPHTLIRTGSWLRKQPVNPTWAYSNSHDNRLTLDCRYLSKQDPTTGDLSQGRRGLLSTQMRARMGGSLLSEIPLRCGSGHLRILSSGRPASKSACSARSSTN